MILDRLEASEFPLLANLAAAERRVRWRRPQAASGQPKLDAALFLYECGFNDLEGGVLGNGESVRRRILELAGAGRLAEEGVSDIKVALLCLADGRTLDFPALRREVADVAAALRVARNAPASARLAAAEAARPVLEVLYRRCAALARRIRALAEVENKGKTEIERISIFALERLKTELTVSKLLFSILRVFYILVRSMLLLSHHLKGVFRPSRPGFYSIFVKNLMQVEPLIEFIERPEFARLLGDSPASLLIAEIPNVVSSARDFVPLDNQRLRTIVDFFARFKNVSEQHEVILSEIIEKLKLKSPASGVSESFEEYIVFEKTFQSSLGQENQAVYYPELLLFFFQIDVQYKENFAGFLRQMTGFSEQALESIKTKTLVVKKPDKKFENLVDLFSKYFQFLQEQN